MACVTDGQPSESGRSMIEAVAAGARTAEDVARQTGLPLFRVRGGLRDLVASGLLVETADGYHRP
ncbi:hypothetical protein [Limnochorda pilosa]|uniref:DprA winged helix domain-containing protein n=1 Tax=Limnochorda pilosa TaxID=1555112 RepID=A0A0K2SQB1_LIMPI|nr:hypothetical protein [Limnochorda pilosa]BAS29315.1 hypothetical protein LIP_3503 [Limnochorda pilosa]